MDLNSVDPFELTPMQSGMLFQWILGRSGAADAGYDIEQIHFVLPETIDPAVLGKAFTQIARYHESLGTYFTWEGHPTPTQQVDPAPVVSVTMNDWRGLDEAQRGKAREEFLQRDRLFGFDLSVAPLMRVSVFDCAHNQTEIVWTVHHIVIDGRSFPVILQQVFAAYDALKLGQEVHLPPKSRPYRDFISWQKQQVVSKSLPFYRELLAGKQVSTPLPCAQSSTQLLPYTGYGRKSLEVSDRVLKQLQVLALETGTTMGVALQAALSLLLSRFTGDQDVLFGTVRSLRRNALNGEAEHITGLLINTLPLRVQLNDECSVAELLGQLKAQNQALRGHSHISLIDIQGQSEIPRGRPLFETLLMFDSQEINRTLRETGDPRWNSSQITVHEQPSLPLTFTVFHGDRLEVRVLFDRRRFTEAVADRIALSFATILDQLSQGATKLLGTIDALPDEERVRIVQTWNATARPFPDRLRIHELFEQQVDSQPEAIAVDMNGVTLSYRELEKRSNQLAYVLRARGAGIGKYIGICLDRSPDMVVALLAVAKSGSPYVPLDPQYPVDRLSFMVQDTAAVLVIAEKQYSTLFERDVFLIDGDGSSEIAASPDTRLSPLGSSRDVCYAIFTSGSTGTPKGVVLCHHAVVNTLDWVTRSYDIGPGDRLLFVTSHCFDLSVYDVFGVLGAGGTVVVASSALLADPQALANAIVAQKITIWDSAPAALQRLVPFFPDSVKSMLRLVMLSGDWIPLTLPDALRASFQGVEVKSMGGATEAAIWSNYFHIGDIDPHWISIPYGKPIQNTAYYVLDAGLRPVPIGVSGDLYIGGVCLADGYLNRPELTRERFIANHLSVQADARIYKTGDLARYWDDGNLEFLGRADFQVKIRGYRVEMGEVEAALLELQHVRDAICSTWIDSANQKSLVAYVVPASGIALDTAAIKSSLARKLPDFMVPSFVVVLEALPVSSNGKLDRKMLPSPLESARETEFAPPETQTEKELAVIWEEVLQCGAIGLDDNFFEMGGHSLLAVMLMTRLRSDMGLSIPLSRIIEFPTIRLFSQALQITARSDDRSEAKVLVNLKRGCSKNLFLVHEGRLGEAMMYRSLAQLMPDQYSVYGVVPRRLPAMPMIDLTIEQMAKSYLAEVRAIQPIGPYYLGGLCSGGVIAYEMAIQLQAMGQEVALVAIMDAIEPCAKLEKNQVETFETNSLTLDALVERPEPIGFFRKVHLRVKHIFHRRKQMISVWLRLKVLKLVLMADAGWPSLLRPLEVENIYLAAKSRYFPRELHSGRVVVLTADDGADADEPAIYTMNDPHLGWGRVVRCQLEAVSVKGGHFTMLQPPHVDSLGKQFSKLLG